MRPRLPLAMLAALFVVIVWAETFISTKMLIGAGLMPLDIFFYRFALAYICIWFIAPKRLWTDSVRDEITLALLGITGGSLYFLAENNALRFSTASNVSILVGSAPVITALIVSAFYKEERLSGRQIAGSLIAFVGMSLVILNGQIVLHLNPVGDMLAVGAATAWAVYSLLMKRISLRYDARFITRKVFAYGLITIVPYFIFVKPLDVSPAVLGQPVVWGNLVYLGLVASLLCFILWNWCIAKLGPVTPTNLIYCQPFFTMLIAAVWLGERISWMAVLGTAILIAGRVLIMRPSERRFSENRKLFIKKR